MLGGQHSSVVSSAHTNLRPRVRIPSTPSTIFSIYIVETVIEMTKRTKINEKEDGIGPHFKTEYAIYLLYMYDAQSNDQHIKRNDLGTPALLVKYFLYYFAKTEK